MGQRFDHHGSANLASTDPLNCRYKFGIETPHKSYLKMHVIPLGFFDYLVAFAQVERHWFFEENVLTGASRQNGEILVGWRRRGNYYCIEIAFGQGFFKGRVTIRNAELVSRGGQCLDHRVDHGDDFT
jgi:hypothetical protein